MITLKLSTRKQSNRKDKNMAEVNHPMKKKLEGKVAIITGGASGVGEATARLFARSGVKAVVIADIQDELGQTVAESIGLTICSYYHCDVTKEEQVQNMVDWTVRTYGQLDIMFSNAGIVSQLNQDIINLDLAELDRVNNINARGMAACVKHAARVMVEGKIKGSIICTASVRGSTGSENFTDYHMSKHAVIGLMRCGCKQLGEYGIRVNTVSPYAMVTPFFISCYKDMTVEEAELLYKPLTSLKQTLKAEQTADAVLFLASDDSGFITGHDLVVDGGFTV